MTATVVINFEGERAYTVPNVRSPEEAEAIALDLLADEMGSTEVEIVSVDSYETGDEEIN